MEIFMQKAGYVYNFEASKINLQERIQDFGGPTLETSWHPKRGV